MIFDSHAHYDDEAFDGDREALFDNMHKDGVDFVVNVGASMDSSQKTLALARKYPFIYGAVGVHPTETAGLTEEDMQWIKEKTAEPKVVAIGEIGLDYHWDEPDRLVQKKWFERQLGLAAETGLPVIIHSRDAAQDTLAILKSWQENITAGVIHCFSYTKEIAREYLDIGYYFGIGGVVTFQNAKKLKEAVEYIPIERILLETDSPYLAPVPYRGKRNSSLNIPFVAKEIAALKGMGYDDVVSITEENAKRLFRITESLK